MISVQIFPTVDDGDGVSRSSDIVGSQVRQVAMVSEHPERFKLWDLTCLLFKAQRTIDLRSGVTTLTSFHIPRVVSFLHMIAFRFHDALG